MAELRKCIGSTRFGIQPHEAPVEDFPKQPSQKEGLGRMCQPHWNAYTTALRKAALAGKATDGGVAGATLGRRTAMEARAAKPKPSRTRAPRKVCGTPPGAPTHVDATPTPAEAVDPDAQEDSVA